MGKAPAQAASDLTPRLCRGLLVRGLPGCEAPDRKRGLLPNLALVPRWACQPTPVHEYAKARCRTLDIVPLGSDALQQPDRAQAFEEAVARARRKFYVLFGRRSQSWSGPPKTPSTLEAPLRIHT